MGRSVVDAGACVSQAVKEDCGMDPWAAGLMSAPAVSVPGMLMECQRQGLSGRFWKPLKKLVAEEGFCEGHSGMVCCLRGAKAAQDKAAQILQGLTVCPGVLQTLCLNV